MQINGFINRIPFVDTDHGSIAQSVGSIYFGVRDDGRVVGFSAPMGTHHVIWYLLEEEKKIMIWKQNV